MRRGRENAARGVRRGLGFVTAGLLVQLAGGLRWTPGTFVLSAAVGVPLVLIGIVLFVAAAWRADADRGGEA